MLNLRHLLEALFHKVEYTASVYDETVTGGFHRGYEDAQALNDCLAIKGWAPTQVDRSLLPDGWQLDRDEADSILLAYSLTAELLMDEERGRTIARQEGIPVRGALGILVQAYRQNLISADQLQRYANQLAMRLDIWISPALCREVLRRVLGE